VASGLLEAVDDPLIMQTLRNKWAASHEVLRAAVERGQKDGSVRNPAPSAALADLLLALMAGLRVNARADFGAARLQTTVDLTLGVLDSA
jgi:TetR/AcrR family transcriptional repressor of nem operon